MTRCEKCGKILKDEKHVVLLMAYLYKKSGKNPLGTLIDVDESVPPREIFLCETCYNEFKKWLGEV